MAARGERLERERTIFQQLTDPARGHLTLCYCPVGEGGGRSPAPFVMDLTARRFGLEIRYVDIGVE
jgi:hypothetical protein